jgi:hypothetical protein
MLPHGGWFEGDGVPENFMSRIAATNCFALEIVCAHAADSNEHFGGIVSLLGATDETNLVLGARQGRFALKLRRNNGTQEFDLAAAPDRATHVAISFDDHSLVGFVGGQRVLATPLPPADLPWRDGGRVLFGDPTGAWRGPLDHVAIYARRLYAKEIGSNAEIVMRRLAARSPVARAVVNAKLVEASNLPTPDSISPYRSAMVAHAYDVVEVLEGDFADRAILAARWAILDQEIQADAARKVGALYRLVLERFDEHPELEGERLVMDVEDVARPLYYEVDR